MARTKNASYGLGEKVPDDLLGESEGLESQRQSRVVPVVYEDPTPPVSEEENTDSGDETEPEPMQPLDMWFQPSEYIKKIKVGTRCYINEAVKTLLKGLKHPLDEDEKRWFLKHRQFKHFFHNIHEETTHKVQGMWMLLLRTARTDKEKEAWFVVNGVPIRYSIREHALISGLNCRNYPLTEMGKLGSMDFVDKYFGEGAKIRYSDVKEKLLKMKRSKDRLKMAVLYFLCSIIKGQTKTGPSAPSVDPFFLRAVNDLKLCQTFPWGRLSFDYMMEDITHTMKHFGGEVKGTQWVIPSFVIPLELLAFEAIPELKKEFREDIVEANEGCPRMCKTRFTKSVMKGFTLEQINETLDTTLDTTKEIQSILVPSSAEQSLLRKIIEEEDVDDVDDVVVNSWMKCVHKDIDICFEEMFKQDMAIRLGDETENVVNKVTGTGLVEPVLVEPGLMELVQSIKKDMEEGFKKMVDKFDRLESRVVTVESYVKEQLDARKTYEDLHDYHNYEPEDIGGGGNDGELAGSKVAHAEECEGQRTETVVDSGEQDAPTEGDKQTEARDDETMEEADENEERDRQQPQPPKEPFIPGVHYTRRRKAQEAAHEKEKENAEAVPIEKESEEAPVTEKEKENVEAVPIEIEPEEAKEAEKGQQSQPIEKGSKESHVTVPVVPIAAVPIRMLPFDPAEEAEEAERLKREAKPSWRRHSPFTEGKKAKKSKKPRKS